MTPRTVTRPGATVVRAAREQDVDAVRRLIQAEAQRGLLLERDEDEIRQLLPSFRVAEVDGLVAGVAVLRDFGESVGELRSLAVAEDQRGRGIGGALVRDVIGEAGRCDIASLFVLTASPAFFERFGFVSVPWSTLPEVLHADRGSTSSARWKTGMVLRR